MFADCCTKIFVNLEMPWYYSLLFGLHILVHIMFTTMAVEVTVVIFEVLYKMVTFNRHQAMFKYSSNTLLAPVSSLCISYKYNSKASKTFSYVSSIVDP